MQRSWRIGSKRTLSNGIPIWWNFLSYDGLEYGKSLWHRAYVDPSIFYLSVVKLSWGEVTCWRSMLRVVNWGITLASIRSLRRVMSGKRGRPKNYKGTGPWRVPFQGQCTCWVYYIDQLDWCNRTDKLVVSPRNESEASTSKSLYMMVKKTCINKLTAFTMTLNRYTQASADVC